MVCRTNPKGVRQGKARARQAHGTRMKSTEGVFVATQEAMKHREREGPERQLERAKARGVAGKTNDLRQLTMGNTKYVTSELPREPRRARELEACRNAVRIAFSPVRTEILRRDVIAVRNTDHLHPRASRRGGFFVSRCAWRWRPPWLGALVPGRPVRIRCASVRLAACGDLRGCCANGFPFGTQDP